jgi:hypothetical protein
LVDFIRLIDLLHWSVFSQDQIYAFFTGQPTKSIIAAECDPVGLKNISFALGIFTLSTLLCLHCHHATGILASEAQD